MRLKINVKGVIVVSDGGQDASVDERSLTPLRRHMKCELWRGNPACVCLQQSENSFSYLPRMCTMSLSGGITPLEAKLLHLNT